MHISSDLTIDQLDEISLKGAVAAGALAAAAVTGGSTSGSPRYLPDAEAKSSLERETFKGFAARQDARAKELAATVLEKYSISDELALKVAKLAIKHEKPKFPRAEDILSVIGIESAFRPHAVSKLKKDPAMGLMQVRPVMWKQNPAEFKANIEQQIKLGADILHKYYQKVGTVDGTLQAYNVGLGNYLRKKGLNPRYVPKFEKDREMYEASGDTA